MGRFGFPGHTVQIWDAQTGQPLGEPFGQPTTTTSFQEGGVYVIQFSPDGQRIAAAATNDVTRIWDIVPTSSHYPDWLFPLAEAISGQHLNRDGILELSTNRVETLDRIRQQLATSQANDAWTTWGRWFLADASARTISPFSKATIPERIEALIQENTDKSLDEAEHLAAENTNLLRKVAAARNQSK